MAVIEDSRANMNRVEQARVKLLYDNLKYAEWTTWLGGTAVSAIYWQNHTHSAVVAWWFYMFLCGGLLIYVRRRFFDDLTKERNVRHAGNMMALALLLNGVGYGLTMWLFWIPSDVLNNVLLTVICMIVFMSYSHPQMPFPRAFVFPAAAVSLGIITKLLYADEFLYVALAAGYVSVIYLFSRSVKNAYSVLSDSIMLRYQLEAANEEVRRASNARNAFFANMSHEIRTPMNGVIGVTQLLAETPLTQEQRKYVGIVESSGRSLLSLIDEILDLTKMESGHLSFSEMPFWFREWADELAQMFTVLSAQKGLGFVYQLDEITPACLVGDEQRLRQIFVNLLGNALKFSDKGEVRLAISVEHLQDKCCTLKFVVEDSGQGMPEEKLSKIFDRFERVDESRIGGTGLGLAICKLLVEEMGGEIHVESWLGLGSRFTVSLELPVGDCLMEREEPPAPKSVTGLAVLVVDDDEINQLVVTRLLSAMNHETTSVSTGKEAIDRLGYERFDLVLMDIHMPDLDGVEATRWIRNNGNEALRNIPVVGMTASIMSDERDAYLDAGMNSVLGKPLSREELDDTIRHVAEVHGAIAR